MIKKIISAFLGLCLIPCVCYASDITVSSIQQNHNTIVVLGDYMPNTLMGYKISLGNSTLDSDIISTGYITSLNDGNFSITFPIKDTVVSGNYTLLIGSEGVTPVSTTLNIVNPILEKINKADSKTFSGIVENYADILLLTTTPYVNTYSTFVNSISSVREKIATTYFANTGKNVSDIETFAQGFKAAVSQVISSNSGSSGGSSGSSSGGGPSFTAVPNLDSNFTPTLVETPESTKYFSDISNHLWAVEAINSLAEKGIVNGVSEKTFQPEGKVTREQAVKMILLSINAEIGELDINFSDIETDSWYAPYVSAGVKQGIVNGITSDIFGVGQSITRQDFCVMVVRAARKMGLSGFEKATDTSSFADSHIISDYAKESIDIMFSNRIINGKGDGCFAPLETCTRAESAKIIYNVFIK